MKKLISTLLIIIMFTMIGPVFAESPATDEMVFHYTVENASQGIVSLELRAYYSSPASNWNSRIKFNNTVVNLCDASGSDVTGLETDAFVGSLNTFATGTAGGRHSTHSSIGWILPPPHPDFGGSNAEGQFTMMFPLNNTLSDTTKKEYGIEGGALPIPSKLPNPQAYLSIGKLYFKLRPGKTLGDINASTFTTYPRDNTSSLQPTGVTIRNGSTVISTVFAFAGLEASNLPPAPSGLTVVNETATGANNGKILGVNDRMEFRRLPLGAWTPVPTGETEITGLSPGGFEVRYISPVSQATHLIINAYNFNPNLNIPVDLVGVAETAPGANNGKIINVNSTMEYRRAGTDEDFIPVKENETEITNLAPDSYEVRFKATVNHDNETENASVIVNVPAFQEPVTPVTERPFIQGFEGNQFRPNVNMLREEAAQMIYNFFGQGAVIDKNILSRFADMPADRWSAEALAWAVQEEIFTGQGTADNMILRPGEPITRAELAVVLHRLDKKHNLTTEFPTANKAFTDISDDWNRESIAHLAAKGVVKGYAMDNGTFEFRPEHLVIRSEAVAMMSRLLNRSQSFETTKTFVDVSQTHWAFAYIMNAANGLTTTQPQETIPALQNRMR